MDDDRKRGRRRPAVRALATAALTTAALATGCTSGGSDPSSAPPGPSISGRIASGSPTLAPLPVAGHPAWSVPLGQLARVDDITAAGPSVVLTGVAADTSVAPMTALDAQTGVVRWSIDDLADFTGGDGASWTEHAPVAAAGANPLLLTDYYVDHCTRTAHTCPAGRSNVGRPEHGVVALSPTDGHVVWQNALIPSVAPGSPHEDDWQGATVDVVGVQSGIAVAVVGRSGSGGAGYDETRTVGLDATTGAVRWSIGGFRALAVAGDHVTGLTGQPHLILSTLGALDLADGTRRWTLSGSLAGTTFVADSGPAVAVRPPTGPVTVTVLRATDGHPVGTIASSSACRGSADLLTCLSGIDPQRLVTYAAGEASPATAAGPLAGTGNLATIVAVDGSYTLLAPQQAVRAYDRAGNPIGSPLPTGTRYVDADALIACTDHVARYPLG